MRARERARQRPISVRVLFRAHVDKSNRGWSNCEQRALGRLLSAAREITPAQLGSWFHFRTFFQPVTQRTSGVMGGRCPMPRQITPRTTLENLKREAKRWLAALRNNVTDARTRFDAAFPDASRLPTLRDVQRAIALEHGLPGWAALKE